MGIFGVAEDLASKITKPIKAHMDQIGNNIIAATGTIGNNIIGEVSSLADELQLDYMNLWNKLGGVQNVVTSVTDRISTELQEDYMSLYNGQVKLTNQVNSITGSLNDAITGVSEQVIRGVDDVIGDTVRGVVTGVTDKALQTLRANMMLDMGTQITAPIMGQLGLQSKNQTAVLTEQIRDNFSLGAKQIIDATGSTMEGISQDLMTNLDSTMKAYSEHLEKSWASELAALQESGLLDNQLMDELNPYLEQGMAVALGSAQTAQAIGQRTLAQVSSLADSVTKYLPLLIVGVGFLMVM